MTPLHFAVQKQFMNVVSLLVVNFRANTNVRNEVSFGWSQCPPPTLHISISFPALALWYYFCINFASRTQIHSLYI
jgi:hypothetical protein